MTNVLKRRPRQEYLPLETEIALDVIHQDYDQDGFICVAHKSRNQEGQNWHQKWHQVTEAHSACVMLQGGPDCYFSLASFFTPKRFESNLRETNTLYVDLDFYKNGIYGTPLDILDSILRSFPWIPCPTLICDSGRGMYLIWAFKDPITKKQLPEWSTIIEQLVETLKPFGADPSAVDASRVLRIPNSMNTKADRQVQALQVGSAIKFTDLKNAVLRNTNPFKTDPETPQKVRKPRKANHALPLAIQGKSWAQKVCEDLELLATLRGGQLTDYRARLLFVYAVQACWFSMDVDQVVERCNAFVQEFFAEPERYNSEKRLTTVIHRMENREIPTLWNGMRVPYRYRMRSRTIIEKLEITPEEQSRLKYLISKDIKQERKTDKRRENGVVPRDEYLAEAEKKRSIASDLFEQGMGVRAVAREMRISLDRSHQYRKDTENKPPHRYTDQTPNTCNTFPHSKYGYLPIEAIRIWVSEGKTITAIAELLGVDRSTVYRHLNKTKEG